MTVYNVIISGSNLINDYATFKEKIHKIICHHCQGGCLRIYEGTMMTSDEFVEEYSEETGIPYVNFAKKLDLYNKRAAFILSESIVKHSFDNTDIGVLIAIYDGKSTFIKTFIEMAIKYNIDIYIIGSSRDNEIRFFSKDKGFKLNNVLYIWGMPNTYQLNIGDKLE